MTLRRKILLLISILTLSIILAMSGTYYVLFIRQIEDRSRDQVTLAFEIVFDDLDTRSQDIAGKLDRFTRSSLSSPMYITQLVQEQYKNMDDAWNVRSVRKIMTPLATIANEINRFGILIGAADILIYNKDGHIQALYKQKGEEQVTGVYLPQVIEDDLIPIQQDDDWYAMLRNLDNIPRQTFPEGLPRTHPEKIPETTQRMLSTRNGAITIQFESPIMQRNEVGGLCVIHVALKQPDVERYSRLSKTKVSLFAGDTLSVGTLPGYNTFTEKGLPVRQLDLLQLPDTPEIEFSEVSVREQDYYQGAMAIGDGEQRIGAITAHFPRSIEKKGRNEFLILVAAITCVFALVTAAGAIILSAIIVRPITTITQLLRNLATGDLSGIEKLLADEDERKKSSSRKKSRRRIKKDEFALLFRSFRGMVRYFYDMVKVADHFSRGEITTDMTPRSEQDVLGHAFARMAAYIKDIAQMAENVAQGELGGHITRRSDIDQLSNALIHMQEGLIALISKIHAGADSTAAISAQVLRTSQKNATALEVIGQKAEDTSSAMQELNSSAEEARLNTEHLTSSVEETSASITQMISSIKQVADNTRKLALFADNTATSVFQIVESLQKVADQADRSQSLAETTTQDAIDGEASVDQMITTINTISEVTENVSTIVRRLDNRSTEIGTILDVINDVAEQTSLLALNASIIAAQAGSQGRAFSVVADEIKELAVRTGTSTKEIAKIVKAVQQDTVDAVQAIEQGQHEVQQGVTVAHNAGEALQKIRQSAGNSSEVAAEMAGAVRQQTSVHIQIADSTKGVADMINEITRATQEQEKNSEQVFKVVENMQNLASMVLRAMQEQQRNSHHVADFMEEVLTLVEENTQTVKQLDQSSHELSSQAAILKGQIERFSLPEGKEEHS